jgi:hypothetical protein
VALMSSSPEMLDGYIDAVTTALGLPVDAAWKPAIRANLEVTLKLARLVDEFPLPDEIEPAEIYES